MHRALAILLLLAVGCTSRHDPAPDPTAAPSRRPTSATPTASADLRPVALEQVATGLQGPLFLTHDGTDARFVVEQPGRVRLLDPDGTLRPEPVLDITDRVTSGGEQGLLGLAFHPSDRSRAFVNYTDTEGHTVVSEIRREGERFDPGSERVLLRIQQPYENHNGGMMAFGPDGMLSIGLGDGGSAGDPHGNAQSPDSFLGKILRIDVEGEGDPYAIPSDNPFTDGEGLREIWAYGLRNPWRFSFDRETGDLWIGDVGQGSREEIDLLPAGTGAGANLGWNITEGDRCFEAADCDREGLHPPVLAYPTSDGCAVTGGYVYRGDAHPSMRGVYLFADYCGGQIWGLDAAAAAARGAAERTLLLESGRSISSFGEDAAGELYVTDLAGGGVYRVVPA